MPGRHRLTFYVLTFYVLTFYITNVCFVCANDLLRVNVHECVTSYYSSFSEFMNWRKDRTLWLKTGQIIFYRSNPNGRFMKVLTSLVVELADTINICRTSGMIEDCSGRNGYIQRECMQDQTFGLNMEG